MNERGSKFDINLVFCSAEEHIYTMYLKHFRDVQRTKVEKMDVLSGEDCLILPLPSSFGLYSSKMGYVFSLLQNLGEEVIHKIQEYILKKYLGEQPTGTAFIIRNPQKNSSFRFIVVVSLFRALTCAGDELARLDPQHVPKDYAYNAMRGCLLAVLRHNAVSDRNRIKSLFCPDFHTIRKEGPGGEKLSFSDFDETVWQMLIAVRGMLEPSKTPKDWGQALLLTTQIIKAPDITEDLSPILESGALESRGLYSISELDQVMNAALDFKNKDKQERAIRVLAACLHRTDDQFNTPKRDVAHRIVSQKFGCLAMILEMVLQRKIVVHTEIPEEELTVGELIGEGNAGAVYRGVWRGKYVAIKQFKKEIPFEDFIKELSIMSLVQHPNLVKCYGGVTNGKKWIIDELMQVNLSQVLLNKHIQIDHGIIAEIAINAAAGIDYLHNHCNLIHRDLKSMNLLINTYKTHLEVKVCDFALSRVISKKEQMTGQVGTVSWTAPEVLVGRKKYNEKADVYSFGIILWELVARKEPYKEMNPVQVILDVTRGKREAIPKECPPELKRLINACWAPKYKQRPSMNSVIQFLRKFHKGLSSVDKAQITLNVTTLIGSSQKSESSDIPSKNPSQSSELNVSQVESEPVKFRSSQITEPISETTSEEV